jgi:hypothetical protein
MALWHLICSSMTVKIRLLILFFLPLTMWGQMAPWGAEKRAWKSLQQEHSKEALAQFSALCRNPKKASASTYLGWAMAFSEPDRHQDLDSAFWAVDSAFHLYLTSGKPFPKKSPAKWQLLDSLFAIRAHNSLEKLFPTDWENYCSGLAFLNHIQSHALDSWSNIRAVVQFWQPLFQMQHDSLEAAPVLISQNINQAQSFLTQASPRWKAPLQDSLHVWAWRLSLNAHSEEAYRDYFENYPQSPYRDSALKKADERAYAAAVASGDPEAYNRYLNDYPTGQFASRSQYYLAYTKVKPVPFLLSSGTYCYVDSSSLKVWLNDSFDFAWPFQLYQNRQSWTENGATFFPQHGLTLLNDKQGNGHYFYITKSGEKRKLQSGYTVFDELLQVSPELLFVRIKGRWGCYHSSDRWVLNPDYLDLKIDTSHSILLGLTSQGWRLFDADGHSVWDQPIPETNFQYSNGAQISLPKTHWILEFPDGKAILNAQSWTLSKERYSELSEFNQGFALASLGSNKAFIDSNGVRFSAPYIENFVGDWAVYRNQSGQFGVINREFASVIPAKHQSVQVFASKGPTTKHAIVYRPQGKNASLRLLNNSVQAVSTPEPIIEALEPLASELGNSVLLLLGKKGYYLYSIQSESIQNTKPFDFVSPISNVSFLTFNKDSDTLSLWVDRQWMGCRIQRPDSQAISKVPIALDQHLLLLESRGKKGVWNPLMEKWELTAVYDEITPLDNGAFLVSREGRTSIESDGNASLACQAQDASGLQFPGDYLILTDQGPTWISVGGKLYQP